MPSFSISPSHCHHHVNGDMDEVDDVMMILNLMTMLMMSFRTAIKNKGTRMPSVRRPYIAFFQGVYNELTLFMYGITSFDIRQDGVGGVLL